MSQGLRYLYRDIDDPKRPHATIKLFEGDELRGMISIRKVSFLPNEPDPHTPCWQVSSIDVMERFRRQGYGTKLYEEAARQAALQGTTLCSDTIDTLSDQALAFWEKQVKRGRAYWEVPGPAEREGHNYDYGRFVLKAPPTPSLSGPAQGPPALALAKRAATYLYESDPEFVVGGCSDVSEVISEWLRKKGYDAKPVYGTARYGKKEWFLHAWIEIEGILFDPVLWVQNRKMEKYQYAPEPNAAMALRCDVETIIEDGVAELNREIT